MRITCPHCHAEHCPEVLPACRERSAATRRLYAAANGDETGALRAENEALRLENEMLRVQPARGAARYPPLVDIELVALLARMGFVPAWSNIALKIPTPSAATAPNPLRRSASARPCVATQRRVATPPRPLP